MSPGEGLVYRQRIGRSLAGARAQGVDVTWIAPRRSTRMTGKRKYACVRGVLLGMGGGRPDIRLTGDVDGEIS
jgi:hypothetical protein